MILNVGSKHGFLCPYCGQIFLKEDQLNVHALWRHTEEQFFKCDQCRKPFFTAADLQSHLAKEGPRHGNGQPPLFLSLMIFNTQTQRWDCCNCDLTFVNQGDLEEHLEVHRPQPVGPKRDNEASGTTSSAVGEGPVVMVKENVHLIRAIRKNFCCDVCSQGFLKKDAYQAHLNDCGKQKSGSSQKEVIEVAAVTNKKKSHCKLCETELEGEEALLKHIMEVHKHQFLINNEFYFCHLCQLKFKRDYEFYAHLKMKHMDNGGNEDIEKMAVDSGKAINTDEEIQVVHEVMNFGPKTCTIKVEVDSDNSGVVGKDAAGELEMCDMCGKQFQTLKDLRMHERIMHGEILEKRAERTVERSKEKEKKRRTEKSNMKTFKFCKSVIEDLQKKVSIVEKVFRKTQTVSNPKDKEKKTVNPVIERVNKKKASKWSCKITARGVKLCCTITKGGREGNSNQKPQLIGLKKKGHEKVDTNRVAPQQQQKINGYECIACGMWLPSVTSLKRHVIRDHSTWVKMGGAPILSQTPEKEGSKSKKAEVEQINPVTSSLYDSVPIPVALEEDEYVDVEGDEEEHEIKVAPEELLIQAVKEEIDVSSVEVHKVKLEEMEMVDVVGMSEELESLEATPAPAAEKVQRESVEPCLEMKSWTSPMVTRDDDGEESDTLIIVDDDYSENLPLTGAQKNDGAEDENKEKQTINAIKENENPVLLGVDHDHIAVLDEKDDHDNQVVTVQNEDEDENMVVTVDDEDEVENLQDAVKDDNNNANQAAPAEDEDEDETMEINVVDDDEEENNMVATLEENATAVNASDAKISTLREDLAFPDKVKELECPVQESSAEKSSNEFNLNETTEDKNNPPEIMSITGIYDYSEIVANSIEIIPIKQFSVILERLDM